MPLLRAGRKAMQEGRPVHALLASRLALKAADGTQALMARAEARRRVADALLELERPDEAMEMLDDARELGGLDRRSMAELNLVAARASVAQGRIDSSRKLLNRAARVFEALHDWRGMVEVCHGQVCCTVSKEKRTLRYPVSKSYWNTIVNEMCNSVFGVFPD